MRKLAVAALLFFAVTFPSRATTYFLATAADGGNDSNNGASATTPWLTPKHSVNCGDVILATPGTSYSYANFTAGQWGNVTCPAGANVAWLKCVTFDACKITSNGGNPGIYVDKSYWGVQGWEVSVTASTYAGCFLAAPNFGTQASVHHIVFANNIANGCYAGGLGAGVSGTGSADYIAIVGNIAYNAAAGRYCYSGIDIYEPIQHDSLPGTHIYIAGNFSFGNFNSDPCGGGIPTDGEGINIDTLDGSQSKFPTPYSAQVVVENNIVLANGGRGLEVENNSAGSAHAAVHLRHNTVWGNNLDNHEFGPACSELLVQNAFNLEIYQNVVASNSATGCQSNKINAVYVLDTATSTSHIYQDVAYSAGGFNAATMNSPGFSFGTNNLFGTNPKFANPVAPSAPSCDGFANVPACMATVIANFTPTNPSVLAYGYQVPSNVQTSDPLFPQWLCNVNLPQGLVTMGCAAASSQPTTPTLAIVKVQ
jgi:hypothetical protein